MTQVQSRTEVFYADPEHDALRVMLPVVLFGSFAVGFGIIYLLLAVNEGPHADYAVFLACAGSIPLGAIITLLAERGLKQIWRSGRSVVVDETQIRLVRRSGEDQAIDVNAPFNVTRWYFRMHGYPRGGRERHISPKWFCLACQLQQEEQRIVVFAFLPPRTADSLVETQSFHRITPSDVYEDSLYGRLFRMPERPKLPARVISSDEGRYWLAERNRWQEGVELTSGDFEKLLARLDGR